jgi:hypothetical protein
MSSLKPNHAANHLEIYRRLRLGYPHIDRPATHQSGFTRAVADDKARRFTAAQLQNEGRKQGWQETESVETAVGGFVNPGDSRSRKLPPCSIPEIPHRSSAYKKL